MDRMGDDQVGKIRGVKQRKLRSIKSKSKRKQKINTTEICFNKIFNFKLALADIVGGDLLAPARIPTRTAPEDLTAAATLAWSLSTTAI